MMADTDYGPPDPQAASPPASTAALPKVGEVRTKGTETRRWDGQAWRLMPRTFMGTEDFTGRMKAFAKPVLGTMASDLNPITAIPNLASAAVYPETHPGDVIEAVKSLFDPATYRGLAEEAKGVDPGNPETVGHVLAALAGPKVYDSTLSGVNKAAHAVAETGSARAGVGYGAGYLGAKLAGQPGFAGAILGRVASPLLKGPAGEVANATDKLLNYLHPERLETSAQDRNIAGTIGRNPQPPPTQTVLPNNPDIVDQMLAERRMAGVPDELKEQYGALTGKFGKDIADRWLAQQVKKGSGPPTGSGGGTGSPPPSSAPTGPPKPPGGAPTAGSNVGGQPIESTPTDARNVIANSEWHEQAAREAADAARASSGPNGRGFPGNGSGPEVGSNRLTESDLNKSLADLRRTFGADRIGRKMRPDAPEVGTGAVLSAAPGPSWMPDKAQSSVLRDLTANKPGDFVRTKNAVDQLLREYQRNSGPANSEVAQQVFQQLKKMGFIKGDQP